MTDRLHRFCETMACLTREQSRTTIDHAKSAKPLKGYGGVSVMEVVEVDVHPNLFPVNDRVALVFQPDIFGISTAP